MRTLPMFPLGSVLFPAMPLALRVFEPRYLIMLDELIKAEQLEFGVVLIERGQEVGGGEQRFGLGTVAEVRQVGADEGFVRLLATGGERFRVEAWLPDDPYPRAEVELLPALSWDSALDERLGLVEQRVRRSLALASEFNEVSWSADIELAEDPMARCWQLAGIAPVGLLDQHGLLGADSPDVILAGLEQACEDAEAALQAPWPEEPES